MLIEKYLLPFTILVTVKESCFKCFNPRSKALKLVVVYIFLAISVTESEEANFEIERS